MTSHHEFQFAPAGPSRQSSDRPAGGLFLPALRPVAIINDQTYGGHRMGQSVWGCDRHAPARFFDLSGQGFLNYGRCFGIGRLFEQYGIGSDGNRSLANFIQSRRQGRFQRFAKGQPRHFTNSAVFVANRRTDNGGQNLGYRGQRHERHLG